MKTDLPLHSIEDFKRKVQSQYSGPASLLEVIRSHHEYLRESILVLKQTEAGSQLKRASLQRFIKVLLVHTKAEEETLYDGLMQNKEAELLTFEAYDEHHIADSLISELRAMGYENVWSNEIEAKAKVLADVVEHHLKEEESQLFEKAEKLFSKEAMNDLAVAYLESCEEYLEKQASPFANLMEIPQTVIDTVRKNNIVRLVRRYFPENRSAEKRHS
jgi:hemerythrin superfamily protein